MLRSMLTGTCSPLYQPPNQRPRCLPATCSQVRCDVSNLVWVEGSSADPSVAGFFVSSALCWLNLPASSFFPVEGPSSCPATPFGLSSCHLEAVKLAPLLSQLLRDHHSKAACLNHDSLGTKQVPLSFATTPALGCRLWRLNFLIAEKLTFSFLPFGIILT